MIAGLLPGTACSGNGDDGGLRGTLDADGRLVVTMKVTGSIRPT
jgi:hypothetical protein